MDEKMEIRLVNPTEDGFLQKIDWNKAELEENVRSIVAAYQGLVYTEDTVSDAKNDRAALRKLLNEIEDRRKLVKKKCMEPYEVFESDLKDVTALIKEQISIIDTTYRLGRLLYMLAQNHCFTETLLDDLEREKVTKVRTAMLTKYPENKEVRGIMKLVNRQKDKNNGFKLTYEAELAYRTEQETLEE